MTLEQHPLVTAMKAIATVHARSHGAQTVGEIRDALAALPPDTPVTVPGGASPSALSSYRGYYERLAIDPTPATHATTELHGGGEPVEDYPGPGLYTPGASEVTIAQPCTARELVTALDLAIGTEFEGYKGGQWLMSRDTLIHVAEYGTSGGDESSVRGVAVTEDGAVISTGETTGDQQ